MENNKKQTAIEWLIEQITLKKYPNGALLNLFIIDKQMEKAKKMEEEQIKSAYKADTFHCSDEDAEQYYNETYKGGSHE